MSSRMKLFLLIIAPALALLLSCLGLETSQMNLMGWFLFVMGVGYMAGGIIYFWLRQGKVDVVKEEAGDRSFWLILPGFIAAFFIPPLEFLFLPEILPRSNAIEWIGVGLIFIGLLLRFWTRSTIKGMYSGHIEIQSGHFLVQNGPYRYIRHPGYAGLSLMALGVPIAYSSLVGLILYLALLIPGLAYRMKVEENLLVEHFGETYLGYKENTKRMIPFIW